MFRFISLLFLIGCGGAQVQMPAPVKHGPVEVNCLVGSIYDRAGKVVDASRKCVGPAGIKFVVRPGDYKCEPVDKNFFRCNYFAHNAYSIDPWE